MDKPTVKFLITFLDGSDIVWDSGISELKLAINTAKGRNEFEVDGVIYFKHGIFSMELVKN